MKFKATYRLIVHEEIEAPDQITAHKIAEAKAREAFRTEDGFDHAQLAKLEPVV